MAVTEKFHFTGTLRDGIAKEESRRTVEITGRDLPRFAAVLRKQAADASAAGDHANALRLQNLARQVERARKFTVKIPLDAKLNDQPEQTAGSASPK